MADEQMMRLIAEQQYENYRKKLLARNMKYANPNWQKQMAKLTPEQEQKFAQWLKANNVNFDPKDKYPDYDMRGYFLSLNKPGAAQTAVNAVDKQLHYPDTFKTPYHESFSNESQWATQGAPSWKGEQLISPTGEIVYETQPQK